MPRVIYSFEEFVDLQKCEWVAVPMGINLRSGEARSRIVFANGATSDGDERHWPPPADERQLRRLRREYLTVRLKREEDDFRRHKNAYAQLATNHRINPMSCPPAPDYAADRLRRGQARVLALREELAEIDLQDFMNPTPEEAARRRHREHREREADEAARHQREVYHQLRGITI